MSDIVDDGDSSPSIERQTADYVPAFDRFKLKIGGKAWAQYASIYFYRLEVLRKALEEEAQRKWGNRNVSVFNRVLDLKGGEEGILIGTLYKEMPLRSSILEEYTREENVIPEPPRDNYISDDDYAILEDKSGRVRLCGKIPIRELTTGMIIALRGHELPNGEFHVSDYCLPGPAVQKPLPEPEKRKGYVALISGLKLGTSSENPLMTEMLFSYLAGELGSPVEQKFASEIVRVVIAGNSFVSAADSDMKSAYRNMLSFRFAEPDPSAMREADVLMSRLASSVPVDIMPGAEDPANFTLPQQPFPTCLLPKASTFATFRSVTNPYEFSVNDVKFIGTSGQNIEDMDKYVKIESKLDILRLSLMCRHIAPTCPDTLASFPFYDNDPFSMPECPHIYFAGNQRSFSTEVAKGSQGQSVRLISIPSFCETGEIVLLDLATLNCHPVSFKSFVDVLLPSDDPTTSME